MKLEFDRDTNITEAIQYVFGRIPPDMDDVLIRKKIADAMFAADAGQASLSDLRDAGLAVLNEILFPP